MKTYDIVKRILEEQPATRNSDKELIWQVYRDRNFVIDTNLSYWSFMSAPSTETIRRCRQSIQKKFPELEPTSESVRRARGFKEATKGTFIFREETGQGTFLTI